MSICNTYFVLVNSNGEYLEKIDTTRFADNNDVVFCYEFRPTQTLLSAEKWYCADSAKAVRDLEKLDARILKVFNPTIVDIEAPDVPLPFDGITRIRVPYEPPAKPQLVVHGTESGRVVGNTIGYSFPHLIDPITGLMRDEEKSKPDSKPDFLDMEKWRL